MTYKNPYTLKCSYEDSKGSVIENWEEDLPNEEVAKDLFERLLLVSNNFDCIFDPDEDGSLMEVED
jgi:hypothetical protein